MAANINPIFPASVVGYTQTFVNADGTTKKTIFTAGANGSRMDNVSITSTDTVALSFNVYVNDGTSDILVGTVSVPIGAGNSASTPPMSLLTSANFPWLPSSLSTFLKTGWTVKMAAVSAVTATKQVSVVSLGGDY